MNSLSFGLLGSGGGDFINLDFGASSIKIAQGSYTAGENPSIDLNMADREPVGNPAPNERVAEFSSALKALLQRNSITEEQKTVLALPTNIVIVRHLELPAMPDERMSQVIRYEAESHIPFPLEEVVLDHHVIERTEDGTEIILIAVKEEKLNEYVEIAHNAGLNPEIIDISAFSLFNLYRKMGSLDDVSSNGGEDAPSKVLVDIGHANTDIIIFKGETLHFARSASVAGESITEQIAKKLGIEIDEAKSLKHEHGHVPLEDIDETEFEDEEEGALEDIAEKKESPDSETEEDTGDLGEEGAAEEGGEEGGLDLGTPAGPSGDEAEEEAEEDTGPDSSGLDLGSPKSPGESDEAAEPEGSEELEQSEQSEEPSEPEEPTSPSPEEEESGTADESPAGGVAPDASIEDEDDEDSGGGIDLGLGESRSPGESPDDETDSDEQASEPPEPGVSGEESQVDEEQKEPEASGESDDDLDFGDSMNSDEVDAGEASGEAESQDTEEPPAPDESETPEPPAPGETDEEDGPPTPPEPGDSEEDSGESAPPPPGEAEEDETPPAPPDAESSEDTDDTPPPPGEDSTTDEGTTEEESAPPPPGESDEDDQPPAPPESESTEDAEEPPSPPPSDDAPSEDEPDGDEDLSLGSSPPPSEETPDEDTGEDEEEGDINLGSTLDQDEKDEEDEDDDDDGSSLTLGAAENNDEDADADPDPDVDRDKIGRAIKPQVDRLIGELRHTFDYFQSQLGGGEVDEVIIVGGGSNLKNLAAYVEDQLDRPAKRFHPVDHVSGIPEEDLQEYLVSTGLTLRTLDDVADLEINLIPEDIIQQRQSRNVQQKITAMGVLGGLLLVQLIGSAYLFYESRRQHHQVSQEEFNKLESIVTRIEDLKQNQQEMDQRNEVIQRLEDQRSDMLALMNELDQLPPELPKTTTWFNSFDYSVSGENSGELSISGVTGDFDDTSRLYQWLESIEYIQDITNQSQSKNTFTFGDQEQSLVAFSATCSVSFDTGSGQGGDAGGGTG